MKKLAKIKIKLYIITISINYHVELILTKNYLYEKTVNIYFVFKACSLCSLKIGTPM